VHRSAIIRPSLLNGRNWLFRCSYDTISVPVHGSRKPPSNLIPTLRYIKKNFYFTLVRQGLPDFSYCFYPITCSKGKISPILSYSPNCTVIQNSLHKLEELPRERKAKVELTPENKKDGGQKDLDCGPEVEDWMPHHNGFKELWDTRWEFPVCEIFVSAKSLDVNTKFQCTKIPTNCKNSINDDDGFAYTSDFIPVAERLTSECTQAANSNPSLTSELYLRATCVYCIARFPYITSFTCPS
jgi:hypothetical protein